MLQGFSWQVIRNMLTLHKLTFNKCSLNMLSVLKLTQNFIPGFLGWSNTGTTCVRTTWSSAQLWGELMKIGSTCARTTCVSGSLVTGSTWTLGQLVHGQHELQGHLLHGQHEHWVKLLHGTVVQGRVKVVSEDAHRHGAPSKATIANKTRPAGTFSSSC